MTCPQRPTRSGSPVAAATAAAVLALALAACGSDEATTTTGAATAEATQGVAVADVDQARNDVDVVFAQQMIPHHRQAVQMADLAVEGAEEPEVLALAEEIRAAQQPEIDQLTAMLQAWEEQVPGDDGAGPVDGATEDRTGHDMDAEDGMPMSGMMSAEQMAALGAAAGPEFDRMFLEMMVEHHEGAVEMAEAHLDAGENPQALALSEDVVRTQQAEIDRMTELLAD